MTKQRNWQRRDFLKLLAHTGVAFPSLASLGSPWESQKPKKRLILIYTSNGQYEEHWYPSTTIPLTPVGPTSRGFKLDGRFSGDLSQVLSRPFAKYYAKTNLLRGLDMVPCLNVRDHWGPLAFNAVGIQDHHAETIDQIVARTSEFSAARTKLRSLFLQIAGDSMLPNAAISCGWNGRTCYPIAPISNVDLALEVAFGKCFSNGKVSELLKSNYKSILNQSILSREDRDRIEAHFDYLSIFSNIHQKTALGRPALMSDSEKASILAKIIGTSIKSDLTRVITLGVTEVMEAKIYSFLPKASRLGTTFHELTHYHTKHESVEAFLEVQRWHASIVLSILDELNEIESIETGATFLDNSVVVWVSELTVRATGSFTFNLGHVNEDLPVCTFGGAAGYLETGQYLDFRKIGVKKQFPYDNRYDLPPKEFCDIANGICKFGPDFPSIGRPYNDFLITLMLAMGVKPYEWEIHNEPGEPGFGRYDGNCNNQYDFGDRRSPIRELVKA